MVLCQNLEAYLRLYTLNNNRFYVPIPSLNLALRMTVRLFYSPKRLEKKKIYELEKSMDRKIIYTPKEGVENGAQRMTSKNSIKLLNSNTEGLKTMKQCLKNCKGIFTFGNVHKVLILT